ncbi:MAG: hypothetical protein KBD01_09035 [Acidobacteria bacterium]|nr:hypothetical protein [Acidobacteriota bacterium]
MSRSMCRTTAVASCAFALVGMASPQPPDAADMAKQYAKNAQQNAALMRNYSWKMRVEVTVKGDSRPASLYQVRYDANGELQKTLLTPPADPQKKRGLRGAIQKNKTEEFRDWAGQLSELVKRYMAPTAGEMMDFYAKATMRPGPDGTAEMSAGDFVSQGDKVTFWVDKAANRPLRFHFATTLDEDPVEGKVKYGLRDDGLQYPEHIVISVPAKKVSAIIETFDYLRQ